MSKNRVQARRDSKGGAPDALQGPVPAAAPADDNTRSLIDVRINKPGISLTRISQVVLCILPISCVAGILSFVLVRGGLSGAVAPAALGGCTGAFAVVSLVIAKRVGQRRMERRIADLIGRGVQGDIASLAQAVAHQKGG